MRYVFGDFELDTQLYELRRAGELLKIEPQVFNVLAYLIEHRDRTVTRQELLDHLWPEQFTSEAVVSYCIMAARKAVGDSGRSQKIIKTLHGRGFRFIAALEQRPSEEAEIDLLTVPETSVLTAPPSSADETTPATAPQPVTISTTSDLNPEDEYQPVTVLCATLINIAELGEQLGFAELQRLRQTFFVLAQDAAQRYKGTLQFFGADGVLILFGVPLACEDHAHQAVLAAMHLQRRLCEPYIAPETRQIVQLAVRMGLHTGPVAVASIPKDQRIASTELGKTMHLAVWLQYLAHPGTLLTSEDTMRQVRNAVPCAILRTVTIPGQPEPVRVYVIRTSEA